MSNYSNNKKSSLKGILIPLGVFLVSFLLLIFASIGIIASQTNRSSNKISTSDISPQSYPESYTEQVEIDPEDELVVKKDYEISEEIVNIQGQLAYIAHPIETEKETPRTIVIYNHGQFDRVSHNRGEDERLMNSLKNHANVLTSKGGYILAASNQHDDDWGNWDAIQDNKRLIDYIRTNHQTNERVYMIGFSMGGYAALNYSKTYPDELAGIVLLAPGSQNLDWYQSDYEQLLGIPLRIWHGENDINTFPINTQLFVDTALSYNLDVEFTVIPEYEHYDTDENLQSEILKFFNKVDSNDQ